MKIDSKTKISSIIKHNKDAIEAIASINPHFKKLRNPILRKVLASRVTIGDAARIGKCQVEDFYRVLEKIGFEPASVGASTDTREDVNPVLIQVVEAGKTQPLDVRPVLEKGGDPFNQIMQAVKQLPADTALEVINIFEPVPLIKILNKKGYASMVIAEGEIVKTYFLKTGEEQQSPEKTAGKIYFVTQAELKTELDKFEGQFKEIDVRDLEMPLPMVIILNELEELPESHALYVNHKKVPRYLLPELEERHIIVWIADIEEGNVKMLIHRWHATVNQ